jgi:hypothetical protein
LKSYFDIDTYIFKHSSAAKRWGSFHKKFKIRAKYIFERFLLIFAQNNSIRNIRIRNRIWILK